MRSHVPAKDSATPARQAFFDRASSGSTAFFSPSPFAAAATAATTAGGVPSVQAKLTLGAPGDRFEREADAMADRVVRRMPAGSLQAGDAPPVQPKCAACREEEAVQRQADPDAAAGGASPAAEAVPEPVQNALHGTSGGSALHPAVRQDMEQSFDADFSSVRIHTGASAERLNQDLGARAFTNGDRIFFDAGQYQPDTPTGRHLLAHELAHVLQQVPGRVQRQEKGAGAVADASATACSTTGQPGAGHAAYDDHAMGPSGTYYIYCNPYNGETPGAYTAAAIDLWIRWRFNNLSTEVVDRIHAETGGWGWQWVPSAPAKGCQALLRMSMNDVSRLVRMAGYDVEARSTAKRERQHGLPELPNPGSFGTDVVIVGAQPGGGAGGSTRKTPRQEAEAAVDPTSVYNQGALGATDPPFPMSMEGPEMEVPNGLGTYTARLQYEKVTDDNGMLLAYGMNSVQYHWEIFNITNVLMRGMSMGNSMLEEARRTQSLAQNLPVNPQAGKAADGANAQHTQNSINELSDETKDALRELRDPVKAAAGGSAIDVVSRAYANYLNLELLGVSAIVAAGGWLVREFSDLLRGYSREKEIAFPPTPGYYMVRCIAQPAPRGPNKSERRASSVRAKIVEVRPPETLAKNALGMADAAIAQLELQKVMTSDVAERARIDRQIANFNEQTSGDLVVYLTRLVDEKEKDNKLLPTWRQRAAERELDALKLRLNQVKDKRDGTGSARIRPQVAFTSTITGDTYPLLVEISPIPLVGDDGIERADRKKVRLFDATVPDREKIDREGATLQEAVANVFEIFRKNGDLGPGVLFVRMPAGWSGPREFSLRVSASGGAVVKKRLEDLATVLLVLSMVVPGVGEISMAIAAGLAAERLISRALNKSLRLDAAAVSDTLAILGAVAQGAQLIGSLRVATSGNAFVGAIRSTEESVIKKAAQELAAAMKVNKALSVTSSIVNAGGMIWGDLVMIKQFADIQAQEMNGTITHAEAARQRASMLANAIVMHGVMLHGMLKPQGADRAGVEPTPADPAAPGGTGPKVDQTPGSATGAPKRAGPPETIPEAELEQRAKTPATGAGGAAEGVPQAAKDKVRTRFRTPDNLHDIFILDDGRIFRCSLVCSQLRDWYDPYLKQQPDGTRRQRASELAQQLEALEARARAGEKSADLDKSIGLMDVSMREFVAPDLAREVQQNMQSRPGAKPGDPAMTVDQTRALLKFFNLEQIARLTGAGGLPSVKAVQDLAALMGALDKVLTVADRGALAPILDRVVQGGAQAQQALDFLGRVSRIRQYPDVVFDLADLHAAFERGDAVLDHEPQRSQKFLESMVGPYQLENGRLQIGGKEGNMPKQLLNRPINGAIDFVLIEHGGSSQLVLGWEHGGLSGQRAYVAGAGRFIINKAGFVVRVDRMSGHYLPSEVNLRRTVAWLIDKGVLMDPTVAKSLGRPAMELDPNF